MPGSNHTGEGGRLVPIRRRRGHRGTPLGAHGLVKPPRRREVGVWCPDLDRFVLRSEGAKVLVAIRGYSVLEDAPEYRRAIIATVTFLGVGSQGPVAEPRRRGRGERDRRERAGFEGGRPLVAARVRVRERGREAPARDQVAIRACASSSRDSSRRERSRGPGRNPDPP